MYIYVYLRHMATLLQHLERADNKSFVPTIKSVMAAAGPGSRLQEEVMGPRAGLPPLLTHLADRPPEQLQWLGVSFGLTQSLHAFWRRSGFSTLYLRQAPSDVTGSTPPPPPPLLSFT